MKKIKFDLKKELPLIFIVIAVFAIVYFYPELRIICLHIGTSKAKLMDIQESWQVHYDTWYKPDHVCNVYIYSCIRPQKRKLQTV